MHRASLDADAIVTLQVGEAQTLRQSLIEESYEVAFRAGEVDDPIPGLLEIRDCHGNRVDLLLGLHGMDPELLSRSLDLALLRRVAQRFGRDAARVVEDLIGFANEWAILGVPDSHFYVSKKRRTASARSCRTTSIATAPS